MIYPTAYSMDVFTARGQFKRTVQMGASYLHDAGFKASVTPEGISEEMTGLFRNGVHPLDGSPGLGLRFGDIVRLQVIYGPATDQMRENLYYGQLRLGGNQYDYEGENMVFSSLMTRLRSTPTPDASYPQMDAGALARALTQSVMNSGILGTTGTPGGLGLNGAAQPGSLLSPISYDPAAMPDLGFTMTLLATNRQPLGVLLDSIVATGKTAGIELRCGVSTNSVLVLMPVKTLEVPWEAERINWKPPQGLVLYTGVLWAISKKADGTWLRYLSQAPEAATYGCEVKMLGVNLGVKPWKPLPITLGIIGTYVVTPAGNDTTSMTIDGRTDTFVAVSNTGASAQVRLTVPAGGANRLYVDAQSTGLPASVDIAYPGGAAFNLRGNDPNNGGFTAGAYYADYFLGLGLPAGAVVTLTAAPSAATPNPTLVVKEFHLDLLDTVLLDGLAKYHYSVPLDAPGDLFRTGILPPSELGGKIRTPRPNGAPDYTANVSLWEYSISASGGVQTAAKTGDPDDPLKAAQAALIRKGDVLATANAQNVL